MTGRKAIREYLDLLDSSDDSGDGGVVVKPIEKPEPPPQVSRRLREVLIECREKGTMTPLREHHRALQRIGK